MMKKVKVIIPSVFFYYLSNVGLLVGRTQFTCKDPFLNHTNDSRFYDCPNPYQKCKNINRKKTLKSFRISFC